MYVSFFEKLGITPCKAEQPVWGMELQKKKEYERSTLQESCLEITYRKNVSVISRHEAI